MQSSSRRKPERPRGGFTLIEMLVATTLVVLMLLMFAEVFGTAVATMRKQQSLAHNDQKARSIESVLRSDLFKATSRQPRVKGIAGLVPLTATGPVDADRQRGYLHIAENDIENPIDDVLQFTIDTRITSRDPTVSVLRGRAQQLAPPDGSASIDSRNQPDYDDGVFGNNVGESHTAEVSYFVRNGNLYRRVLLLREPPVPSSFVASGAAPPPGQFSSQPGVGLTGATISGGILMDRMFMRTDGTTFYAGDYAVALDTTGTTSGNGDFWSDFDYSAFNLWQDLDGGGTMDAFPTDHYLLMFNGEESLQNTPGATPFPIARPEYRFGHRPPAAASMAPLAPQKIFAGQPMDYLLDGSFLPVGSSATPGEGTSPRGFIGRFTHEETSCVGGATGTFPFCYPGSVEQDGVTGGTNPMLQSYTANWDGLNQNGLVDGYESGLRAAEDLILSNVEAFDIEVWDDGFVEQNYNHNFDASGLPILDPLEDINGNGILDSFPAQWVNLGHNGFHPAATDTTLYPNQLTGLGWFHSRRNQNPNYGGRVLNLGTNNTPGVDGTDDDGNGVTDDKSEIGWPGSDDIIINRCFDTWHPQANVGAYDLTGSLLLRSGDPPFGGYKIRIPGWTGSLWAPQWEMHPGHYIFPGVTEDPNCNLGFDANEDTGTVNRKLDGGEDVNGNNALDPLEIDVNNSGFVDHYEDRNHDGLPDIDTDSDGFIDEDQPAVGSLANGDGFVNAYTRDDWSYYYRPVGYTSDFNNNGVWDTGEPDVDGNNQLDRFSGAQEPEWPREPGATVVDGNVVWQCFDNRVSLPMIRITVRYRDQGTGLPRQVSIVHSFVE